MSIGSEDFDVFVLTHNRSKYLPDTLDSLLAQSLGAVTITVLDNASTDDTEQVIAPYVSRGARHVRAPRNLGWRGNLARAQQLAVRPWVMAFHDDDVMHPDYLAEVAKAIEEMPDLAVVASNMTFETAPNTRAWPPLLHAPAIVCRRPADLARLLYRGFPLHFGSAVYRAAVFRGLTWDSQYGKIADRPFLLDAADRGTAVILPNAFIRYRLHAGQDSGTAESGPFIPELSALHARYRDLLGTSIVTRNGRTFLSQFYTRLRSEFPRLSAKDRRTVLNARSYVETVRKAARISPASLALSKLYWFFAAVPRELIRGALRNRQRRGGRRQSS